MNPDVARHAAVRLALRRQDARTDRDVAYLAGVDGRGRVKDVAAWRTFLQRACARWHH